MAPHDVLDQCFLPTFNAFLKFLQPFLYLAILRTEINHSASAFNFILSPVLLPLFFFYVSIFFLSVFFLLSFSLLFYFSFELLPFIFHVMRFTHSISAHVAFSVSRHLSISPSVYASFAVEPFITHLPIAQAKNHQKTTKTQTNVTLKAQLRSTKWVGCWVH